MASTQFSLINSQAVQTQYNAYSLAQSEASLGMVLGFAASQTTLCLAILTLKKQPNCLSRKASFRLPGEERQAVVGSDTQDHAQRGRQKYTPKLMRQKKPRPKPGT